MLRGFNEMLEGEHRCTLIDTRKAMCCGCAQINVCAHVCMLLRGCSCTNVVCPRVCVWCGSILASMQLMFFMGCPC